MDDNPYKSPETRHEERLNRAQSRWTRWPFIAALLFGTLLGAIAFIFGLGAFLLLTYGLLTYGVKHADQLLGLFLFFVVAVLGAIITWGCRRLLFDRIDDSDP